MIKDSAFKKLFHNCNGYIMNSNGNAVEIGYHPDYTMRKGNDYMILESENSSNRKTFVGGFLKAAHFLQKKRTGVLVFIIVPRKNTTVPAIAKHLKKYFEWVSDLTNLREVYVIEAGHYYKEGKTISLLGKSFKKWAVKV